MTHFFKSILGGKFRTGQLVRFECGTGIFHTDTIRACFYQTVDVLRLRKGGIHTVGHRKVPAILLDNHSWVACKDAKHCYRAMCETGKCSYTVDVFKMSPPQTCPRCGGRKSLRTYAA